MSMAGELLGEKNQEKLFNLLLKRQENQICADCPTKAPTWVSLDFGIFVCMNCSAAHRHLSRNVTRVYSTKIDSWNKSNFQIMDHIGNEIANSYFQFNQPTRSITINSNPDDRVRFVTDKYVRKLYANPKSENPVLTFVAKRERGILERPYQNTENNQAPNPHAVNLVNDKEFISNNAAGSLHNDRVRQEQKELKDKRMHFVSYNPTPQTKPKVVDLLDFDEPQQPPQQQSQQQKPRQPQTHQPQQQSTQNKVNLLDNDDDDTFTNWVSAPTINTTSQPPQHSNHTNSTSNSQPASSNLLDLYNYSNGTNGNPEVKQQTHQQSHQLPKTNLYIQPAQQQQQQKPQQQIPQVNQQNSQSISNNSNANKSVDLMSLYSNSSSSNPSSVQQTAASTTANQQQVDKNRFQALNQMGQYPPQGTAYYPYYHMHPTQQGYGYQQQTPPPPPQGYGYQQAPLQQQPYYAMQNPTGYQTHMRWP